jgi:hypothetical protein
MIAPPSVTTIGRQPRATDAPSGDRTNPADTGYDAGHCAGDAEDDRLDNDERKNLLRRRADGLSNHELTCPAARANRQQIREVHDANQQQHQNPGLQEDERRTNARDVIRVHRHDDRAEAGGRHCLCVWIDGFERGILRIDVALRRRE